MRALTPFWETELLILVKAQMDFRCLGLELGLD